MVVGVDTFLTAKEMIKILDRILLLIAGESDNVIQLIDYFVEIEFNRTCTMQSRIKIFRKKKDTHYIVSFGILEFIH